MRIICFLVVVLPIVFGGMPVRAQTTPRGAEHADFGRMVFDWDGPVKWSAEIQAGKLLVKFDKPAAGDPKTLQAALPKYVKSVVLTADRRSLTFDLARPVQLKTFLSGNSTVIDLQDDKKVVAAAKPTDVMVRGGEHTGFNRLVFDWPKPVPYSVESAEGRAVIAFERPANVNETALTASLPSDVRLNAVKDHGAGTAVVLDLPPGMRVRHFTSGPKVALDLVRAVGSPPPPRAEGVPPPPLAPAPGSAMKLPGIGDGPATVENAAAPTSITPPAQPAASTTAAAPAPAAAAAPAPPAAAKAPVEQEAPAAPKKPAMAVSLGIPFDQAAGAAAFRRAGWLWLVFDRKVEVDVKLLKRTGGEVVLHAEQVPGVRNGTAVRLLTRAGFNPNVRKEGQLWVFDLLEQPLEPKLPLAVNRQFDFEDRGRLLIPAKDAPKQSVVFRDPEVGDTVQVMPLLEVGAGIQNPITAPGVELPATAQGVALLSDVDGARLDADRNGLEVGMPGGLYLSRDLPALAGGVAGDGGGVMMSAGGPVDPIRWMRGGEDAFVKDHQALMNRMAHIRPDERNQQRIELARHYVSNGMAAEALGILRLVQQTDPAQENNTAFRGVRGLANYMMGRDAEAEADLAIPELAKDPQAQLWLAAARSRMSDMPQKQALMLRLAPEDMKGLNGRLRMALGREAVRATAAAGDAKGANRIIEAINGPGLHKRDFGAISRLQGDVAKAAKQWDQAIAKYKEAEEGESRPDRAYAGRDRVELQLRRGLISTADAISQLEKLRFAWRGEDFEYQLLKRLAELMVADSRFADALRLMRSMVGNFSEHPDIPSIQKMMADTFEHLYLGGAADSMTPVAAIGLYDEFQELTPSGAKGDEMIRRLADRLAAVDLLDRSAELLRHQVRFRLNGADKARVGARLAGLYMSDHKARPALEALDASETADQPADLYNQRRYMRVRILADLGRTAEALALIVNDNSDKAKELRADIYWDLKRWPEAVKAIEDLIEPPFGNLPIEPKLARRVVDLATAMTLSKDERGLGRLRREYGGKMAQTQLAEAFALLTAAPERGIIDPESVPGKIQEVQRFQDFMSEWSKRMQPQGPASLN